MIRLSNTSGTTTTVETFDAGVYTRTVNGVQQEQRALTAAETALLAAHDAAETRDANRVTIEAALATFLTGASTAIANMQAIQNDPAPSFSNLAQALTQVTALQNRVKQIAQTEEAHIRKTVALARYVSNQLDSLDNT